MFKSLVFNLSDLFNEHNIINKNTIRFLCELNL